MRQIRLLAGTGIAALLVSLVLMFPARVALGVFGVPAGAATAVSGSIWHGSAGRLALGNFSLGPVSWKFMPSRLLLGRLATAVEARLPDGFANGVITLSPVGGIAITDLEAAAPLQWIAPAMGGAGSQLTARFERLKLSKGRVASATGTLQLAGVVLPVRTGARLDAGSYAVTFDGKEPGPDEALTGLLKDNGGPLEIAGTVKITPPRSYELNGTAKARPDAPPELRNTLQMLGPATPDGGHALSLAGSF